MNVSETGSISLIWSLARSGCRQSFGPAFKALAANLQSNTSTLGKCLPDGRLARLTPTTQERGPAVIGGVGISRLDGGGGTAAPAAHGHFQRSSIESSTAWRPKRLNSARYRCHSAASEVFFNAVAGTAANGICASQSVR